MRRPFLQSFRYQGVQGDSPPRAALAATTPRTAAGPSALAPNLEDVPRPPVDDDDGYPVEVPR